jgi:hypothetical protein
MASLNGLNNGNPGTGFTYPPTSVVTRGAGGGASLNPPTIVCQFYDTNAALLIQNGGNINVNLLVIYW